MTGSEQGARQARGGWSAAAIAVAVAAAVIGLVSTALASPGSTDRSASRRWRGSAASGRLSAR